MRVDYATLCYGHAVCRRPANTEGQPYNSLVSRIHRHLRFVSNIFRCVISSFWFYLSSLIIRLLKNEISRKMYCLMFSDLVAKPGADGASSRFCFRKFTWAKLTEHVRLEVARRIHYPWCYGLEFQSAPGIATRWENVTEWVASILGFSELSDAARST